MTAKAEDEKPAVVEEATERKSIINSKYKDKYKNRSEWMSDLLKAHGSITTTHAAVPAKGEEGKEGYIAARPERVTIEGVDVDKVFAIARENGLDVDKYEAQRDGHGFPGRFRMTVGNMLRATAKARHGIKIAGDWHPAPEDWLTANGAPIEPTHDHDGARLTKAAEPKAETESKLIKADAKAATETPTPKATSTTAKKK